MLLKRLTPSLPAHLRSLIPQLEAAGIRTTDSVLFTAPSTVISLVPDLSEWHLQDLTEAILAIDAPPAEGGDQSLQKWQGVLANAGWAGFGVLSIDEILGDWDGVGILELAGAKRTGKSLMALHAACRLLSADEEAKVCWIDTTSSFSPERARKVLELLEAQDPVQVLQRLVVQPCYRLEPDLFETIEALAAETADGSAVKMLVIDSIQPMLQDGLRSGSTQGFADMVTIMENLDDLTFSRGLTAIVTNDTVSSNQSSAHSLFSSTTVKPALGASFQFFADITLLLQDTARVFGLIDAEERERRARAPGGRTVVEVVKSRVGKSGLWAAVDTDGIRLSSVVPPPLEDERTLAMSRGQLAGERPLMGPLRETVIP